MRKTMEQSSDHTEVWGFPNSVDLSGVPIVDGYNRILVFVRVPLFRESRKLGGC